MKVVRGGGQLSIFLLLPFDLYVELVFCACVVGRTGTTSAVNEEATRHVYSTSFVYRPEFLTF